jgi:hypothetical protein
MRVIFPEERITYTGEELASLWAYHRFRVQEDSIVAFRGGCEVKAEHMIDLEDRLGEAEIYSPDMLHFIVEHFDSTSLKLTYARQRLLAAIACEAIAKLGYEVVRRGDDLYYEEKKLSVSIASVSPVSAKIHFGINVKSDKYMSLERMGVKNPMKLLRRIAKAYADEISDIERDLRKAKPLGVYHG